MAILETGLSWGTTSGAAEHFAAACHASDHGIAIVDPQQTMTKFIDWIVQVVKAIDMHKNEPSVKKKRNEAYKHVITRFKTKGEYNLPKAKHSGSASGANDNSKMMVDPQQTITWMSWSEMCAEINRYQTISHLSLLVRCYRAQDNQSEC